MTRRLALSLTLAASLAAGAGARPGQVPASTTRLTPAERDGIVRAGAQLVEALSAGRQADVLALFAAGVRASVGDARLGAQFDAIRAAFGALTFHHAELTEFPMGTGVSRVLHVFARSARANGWKDLQVRLEPAPPYRFQDIAFIADVAEPTYLPNGDLPLPSTVAWLDDYVTRLAADEDLSGSLLVTIGPRVVVERSFGFADAARARRVTADTRFSMASASKMFTAVVIAQLVDAGRLKYSDPIGRYFPSAPGRDVWSKVTIDQLLSHRSGIGEYWTEEFSKNRSTVVEPNQFLPWIYKAGQDFPPGTRYGYSNSNFLLLGLIVEQITGRPFAEEVRRRVFEPLGMTSTSMAYDASPASRDAEPLSRGDRGWTPAVKPVAASPAGGAWTTAREAAAFMRGLAGGRLVPPATLSVLTTPRTTGLDTVDRYGYGLQLGVHGNVNSYGHGGIAAGMNAEVRYFPALDATLVVFSNQDNGAYDDLRRNVIKLITGVR